MASLLPERGLNYYSNIASLYQSMSNVYVTLSNGLTDDRLERMGDVQNACDVAHKIAIILDCIDEYIDVTPLTMKWAKCMGQSTIQLSNGVFVVIELFEVYREYDIYDTVKSTLHTASESTKRASEFLSTPQQNTESSMVDSCYVKLSLATRHVNKDIQRIKLIITT